MRKLNKQSLKRLSQKDKVPITFQMPRPSKKNTRQTTASSRNGSARREEILETATDLFYERGYENGSLRDIARVMGFTQAAIYYHFPSKDEIFFCILDRFTEIVFQAIKDQLDTPGDPAEVLRKALRQHVSLSRDYMKEVKLLIEDRKLLSDARLQIVRAKERKIFDLYRRHFEKLRAANLILPISPTIISFSLISTANSVYQWYDRGGSLSIEEISDQLAQLYLCTDDSAGQSSKSRTARSRAKAD